MEISLFNTVLLDGGVWFACIAALLALDKLSFTHPATTYFAFHGLFFSGRAVAVLNGAPTLFSGSSAGIITQTEISRALLLADLGLLVMTAGWILAARIPSQGACRARPLRVGIIDGVSAFAIPAGCIAMALWSKFPGFETLDPSGPWATSNWIVVAQTWAGLGLLGLIYWYGFRPLLVTLLGLYLAFAVYQGAFRFRVLIPIILVLQIYLDRRGRRWPPVSGAVLVLSAFLLFFPLKEVGERWQAGDSVTSIWKTAEMEVSNVFRGEHPDQTILDQFAGTLSLADQHAGLFWGRTYSGVLTVIVPRQWWPEKPGLADFEKEISTSARPIAENGMVVTMLGEFYVNFSYFGLAFLAFAVAYATGKCFHAAYARGYFTLGRFMYLLLACNLIQVYRDGLISLFVFLIINMMPLTAIVFIHLLSGSAEPAVGHSPILTTARVRSHIDRRTVA